MDANWSRDGPESRDELEQRMKVLLEARQRLIEAEAQGRARLDRPATEQVDGADGSYLRAPSAPTAEPSVNVNVVVDPIPPPMVTQQDNTEGFYPLGDDACFDERFGEEEEEEATTTQHACYYHPPLADSELCNYEDDDVVEDHQEPVPQDALATGSWNVPQSIHQVSTTAYFGQDYRDYVLDCDPGGTAENQSYTQGSAGGAAAAPGSEPFSYNADSLNGGVDHPAAVSTDDFYPLDDEPAAGNDAVQWESHVYPQRYYHRLDQPIQFWYHLPTEVGNASGRGYNGDEEVFEDYIREAVLAGRLHVIEGTPAAVLNDNESHSFGGVPASMDANWSRDEPESRDELEQRMKVLLEARQRLIEAEAQGHARLDRPSSEQVDAADGRGGGYLRGPGAPTTEPSVNPMPPMVTQQDTEGFYPLDDDDACFDERFGKEEEDATMQPACYYHPPLAESELCNYEDDDVVEDHQEPVPQDALATGSWNVPQSIHQVSTSVYFGQDYRDYVLDCVPSAAAAGGTAENQEYTQGSAGGAAAAPGSEPFSYTVDSLHGGVGLPAAVSSDDFYPLDDEPAAGTAVQWEGNVYPQRYYHRPDQPMQSWYHMPTENGAASGRGYNGDGDGEEEVSGDYMRETVLAGSLHVPHIVEGTPAAVFNDEEESNGFGGVPASAAAIAGLEEQKYDGASGADGGRCVICMRDYKKGKRLVVMPCEYRHRFHGKCLREWLSRSHLCPLCRHALPTEDQ